MFRIVGSCGVFVLSVFYGCLFVVAVPQTDLPTVSKCNELIQSTLPTVVQLIYQDDEGKRHCYGCGVIVSPEGHIVVSGMVGAVLDNVRLKLQLTDGRQVTGEALGWSREFNVGMFKITEPGEWPYIRLCKQIHAGDICFALGCSMESAREFKDGGIEARLGVVGRSAIDSWFTTPYQTGLTPHPVFNLDGELIGLAAGDRSSGHAGEFTMHVSASVLKQHWDDLVAGIDLDRKRLVEQTNIVNNLEPLTEKMTAETLSAIKAASVQIGVVGEKLSFSGVLVQDGFVVSCAHHHRLPGTEFNVVLADGRSVVAMLLNTNWLTDISLLKVTTEGNLPQVNFGKSSRLNAGDTVITIGYPHRNDQKAIVLETKLAKNRNSINYRELACDELYSAGEEEEVSQGLSGVSGGGVFDSTGALIGIHKGLVSAGARWQLRFARIELFSRNWESLAKASKVEAIDAEKVASVVRSLTELTPELKIEGLRNDE